MQINADFTQPALVHPQQHQWVASPQAGVERIMLDRTGAERGRATSIVRYAPDSRFPHHQHPAGEEILVLSGVFSEGDHHYPQGWYLRNPAGSGHAPHSAEGAVIFVKLGHLSPAPNAPAGDSLRINTHDTACWATEGEHAACELYRDADEHTRLLRLAPQRQLPLLATRQTEAFVIQGSLQGATGELPERGWLRLPPGSTAVWNAGAQGATVFLKSTAPHIATA